MQKKLTRLTEANLFQTLFILYYRKAQVSQSDARQIAQQFLLAEHVTSHLATTNKSVRLWEYGNENDIITVCLYLYAMLQF